MKRSLTYVAITLYLISWVVNFGVLFEIEEHAGEEFASLYSEETAIKIPYIHAFPLGLASMMLGYEFNFPWVVFAPLNLLVLFLIRRLITSRS